MSDAVKVRRTAPTFNAIMWDGVQEDGLNLEVIKRESDDTKTYYVNTIQRQKYKLIPGKPTWLIMTDDGRHLLPVSPEEFERMYERC